MSYEKELDRYFYMTIVSPTIIAKLDLPTRKKFRELRWKHKKGLPISEGVKRHIIEQDGSKRVIIVNAKK
jgi:hypothetical protein